ncbi:hypothetical protein KQX66_36170, partial [Paenibacillus sp. SM 69]|nr:hypothetical protein [Paenibacillus oleatilyticus]
RGALPGEAGYGCEAAGGAEGAERARAAAGEAAEPREVGGSGAGGRQGGDAAGGADRAAEGELGAGGVRLGRGEARVSDAVEPGRRWRSGAAGTGKQLELGEAGFGHALRAYIATRSFKPLSLTNKTFPVRYRTMVEAA